MAQALAASLSIKKKSLADLRKLAAVISWAWE